MFSPAHTFAQTARGGEALLTGLTEASGGFLICGAGQLGIGRRLLTQQARDLQRNKSPLYFPHMFDCTKINCTKKAAV